MIQFPNSMTTVAWNMIELCVLAAVPKGTKFKVSGQTRLIPEQDSKMARRTQNRTKRMTFIRTMHG
jgi:hypothetical protein